MRKITKEEVEFNFNGLMKSDNLMRAYIEFIIKRYNETDEDVTSLELKSALIDMGYKNGEFDIGGSRNLFQLLLNVNMVFGDRQKITEFINTDFKPEDTMSGKMPNHQIISYLKEYKYPVVEEDRVKLMKYYYLEMNKNQFDEDEYNDAKKAIKNNTELVLLDRIENKVQSDRRLLN